MSWKSVWLRRWWWWAVPGTLVLLNLVWLAGLRGAVLGRGSLLSRQVDSAERAVRRLEAQRRQLGATQEALDRVQAQVATLREQRLAPMKERLVPFLKDLYARSQEAGLTPDRIGFAAAQEQKSDLAHFTASFSVTGKYQQIRKLVYLLEASPQFIVVEHLGLRGRDEAASLDVTVQMVVGTYFSDIDVKLLKELGITEVKRGGA